MMAAGDVLASFDDAVAVLQEFDGAPIDEKLAVFGVDASEMREVLEQRWEVYRHGYDPEQPHLVFVQALVEGLLAGLFLKVRLQS